MVGFWLKDSSACRDKYKRNHSFWNADGYLTDQNTHKIETTQPVIAVYRSRTKDIDKVRSSRFVCTRFISIHCWLKNGAVVRYGDEKDRQTVHSCNDLILFVFIV